MKKRNTKPTFDEGMCDIFHKWMAERDNQPGELGHCYDFAREHGLWQPSRMSHLQMFKMQMSKALSRERKFDSEGNPIRQNHVLRIKGGDGGQIYLWNDDMLKLSPSQARMSLKQRVHGLGNRAVQIDRDKSYYNKENTFGAQIDLDYNLNMFVENAQNPTEYPDERPDGEDGEPGDQPV